MKISSFACCCTAFALLFLAGGCARRSPAPTATSSSPQPPKTSADVRAGIRLLTSDPEAIAKEFLQSLRFDDPKVSYQSAHPLYRKLGKLSQHEEQVAILRGALGSVRQQQTWNQSVGISADGVYANLTFRLYGEVQPADAFLSLVHQSGKWSVIGFHVQFPTNIGFPKNTTERT